MRFRLGAQRILQVAQVLKINLKTGVIDQLAGDADRPVAVGRMA
jgi:hypothetical protein